MGVLEDNSSDMTKWVGEEHFWSLFVYFCVCMCMFAGVKGEIRCMLPHQNATDSVFGELFIWPLDVFF